MTDSSFDYSEYENNYSASENSYSDFECNCSDFEKDPELVRKEAKDSVFEELTQTDIIESIKREV